MSIPSIDNAAVQKKTFNAEQLLRYGARGTHYQVLVLLSKAIKLLIKKTPFEARLEVSNRGNLDDIAITTLDVAGKAIALNAYQVKYYKSAITANLFTQKKENKKGKTEKMHIGKFFDGWLSWKGISFT